ncbi:MAG TPA: GreA/GreB family elongation factor [Burkholderiales bacterium]|nr:GreA/GreB family elongation factor [Burkholderiales bacterium]
MENLPEERIVSRSDAESLASVLGRMRTTGDAADADALFDLLEEASLVPHDRLPADRIAMHSRVTYEELATGTRRTVVLVHPSEADPAQGRLSVLSPVGRALLGRRPGTVVATSGPGGRSLSFRILEAERTLESPQAQ